MYPESPENLEDTVLLQQLSEGSKHAFDVLYNRHWKQVFNAAYKRLNHEAHAQDIAQDVFVQLWIRSKKSPIENLPAYLRVAARNGVFKFMEREEKYAQLPDTVHEMESQLGNADSPLLHAEFLTAFNQLILALPTQQRLIFTMRFEEDLNSAQIAEKLQISPKTVRNQLGKALSSLRSSLLFLHLIFMLIAKR